MNMIAQSDSMTGLLLLAVPWLLLALAAWRAMRLARRRAADATGNAQMTMVMTMREDGPETSSQRFVESDDRAAGSSSPNSTPAMARAADAPLVQAEVMPPVQPPHGELAPHGLTPERPPAVADDGPPAASPAAAMDDPAEDARLVHSIEAAEGRGDLLDASRTRLVLARRHLSRGGRAAAEPLLLQAVMVAAKGKFAAEHAAARIELADLARMDGDMTTACEHWQMAKQLFHELDRRDDIRTMADNLRINRCPTDWFLTGF